MKIYNLAFLFLLVFPFACNEALEFPKAYLLPDGHPDLKTEKAETAKIVFKSTDGGQTWEDISKGLPENLRKDSIRGNSFFANDKGLFFRVGNGLYHSTSNATTPFWTKEISPDQNSSLTPGKPGILYWGANLKKTNGTSVWSPIFENLDRPG
ncbi:MAG: hypothetical protein ABIN25_08240, partial [Ginsengibacter sp.]